MLKRIGIMLVAVMLVLSGCSGTPDNSSGSLSSESTEESMPVMIAAEDIEEDDRAETVTVPDEKAEEVAPDSGKPEDKNDDKAKNEPNESVPEGSHAEESQVRVQENDVSGKMQTETTSPPDPEPESSSFREVESSEPEQTSQEEWMEEPEVPEPEEGREPETETEPAQEESTVEEPVEEPNPEPEPEFDIGYWISYAQGLAQSKGLRLESSAVDCWDNPITANASCIYLERDLNARLDRYAGDSDITDVWIWYEDQGNGRYLIYIGYA